MIRPSLRIIFTLALAASFGAALVSGAEPELVDIRSVDPTILVELRYAGSRNIAQRALYPPNFPALVRPVVAAKLSVAQTDLLPRGYRLKIWDAYRPKYAHDQHWALSQNKDYVANPADGLGSLHTWGVAVDATLVDDQGHEVAIPTDFDEFTPAAMLRYLGNDPGVRMHLHTLQRAMGRAGFFGMRTEWWHFISKGWMKFRTIPDASVLSGPTPANASPDARAGNSASSPGLRSR